MQPSPSSNFVPGTPGTQVANSTAFSFSLPPQCFFFKLVWLDENMGVCVESSASTRLLSMEGGGLNIYIIFIFLGVGKSWTENKLYITLREQLWSTDCK